MEHLSQLIFLIDSAKAITGSDNKTAQLLGVSRGNVSDWRNGRNPCPPEMQALLASIAGFDPQQTALRALVERHEGTALGDKLMRVLGKPSLAIGAAAGFVGLNAIEIGSTALRWLATQCALRFTSNTT